MKADADAELRQTAHCLAIRPGGPPLSGYGMFFWKPKAGAHKVDLHPQGLARASMIAVVSGSLSPGNSSIESSRR